jgi:hypothetical protein
MVISLVTAPFFPPCHLHLTRDCRRSPNGRWLVSGLLLCALTLCVNFQGNFLGSADNKIIIWETVDWSVQHILVTPAAHVLALAWWRLRGWAEDSEIDDGSGGIHALVAGTWEGQLLLWLGTNASAVQIEL